jgi:hypothetical protein
MAKRSNAKRHARRGAGTELRIEARRGWPVSVEWDGSREAVMEIADFWVVEGQWWRDSRRRVYFRIRTAHRMLDIYVMGGRWTLSRVWD